MLSYARFPPFLWLFQSALDVPPEMNDGSSCVFLCVFSIQIILKNLKIKLKKDSVLKNIHPDALDEYNRTTRHV